MIAGSACIDIYATFHHTAYMHKLLTDKHFFVKVSIKKKKPHKFK